jgi:hypothetical protein
MPPEIIALTDKPHLLVIVLLVDAFAGIGRGAVHGAHSLKLRLARWLLMMRDRSDEDALQSLRLCSPKCWACSDRPSRMLRETWSVRV